MDESPFSRLPKSLKMKEIENRAFRLTQLKNPGTDFFSILVATPRAALCGSHRARTDDLCLAKAALFQLS
jgi:hypothetical protein